MITTPRKPPCRASRPRRGPGALALAAGLLLGVGSPVARAESTSPEFDPLNHAYAVYLGSGIYVSETRSVFVFRVAPKINIRSEEEHPFGIRLRINGPFGFSDLKPLDFLELDFPDRLGTFAIVPGVEFPVKLYPNWTLMPFVDFGAATDTKLHDVTYVIGTGARSRAEFRDRRHVYLLWNELIWANNLNGPEREDEDYSLFRTDFELMGLVDVRLSGRDFDLGVLAKAEIFLDGLIIDRLLEEPEFIRRKFDVGLTFGPSQSWKVFKRLIPVPRLGVAYRFGSGSSAVSVTFRTRY